MCCYHNLAWDEQKIKINKWIKYKCVWDGIDIRLYYFIVLKRIFSALPFDRHIRNKTSKLHLTRVTALGWLLKKVEAW